MHVFHVNITDRHYLMQVRECDVIAVQIPSKSLPLQSMKTLEPLTTLIQNAISMGPRTVTNSLKHSVILRLTASLFLTVRNSNINLLNRTVLFGGYTQYDTRENRIERELDEGRKCH